MHAMIRLIIVLTLVTLCSCKNTTDSKATQSAPHGNPALKDYVKIPLDRAKLAGKINDKHNQKVADQIKELDQ